jgi:UDP:flavonoid glycosyltransferase YjiC (YdhE family)
MANIVFLMLPEKGHLNSSFKIAKTLKSRGHHVYYLQIPRFDEYIGAQGLEFVPLFESVFPKDYEFNHTLSTVEILLLRLELEATALGMEMLTLLKREVRDKLKRVSAHMLILDINTAINPGALDIEIPCVVLNSTIIPRPVYTDPPVPILVLCPEEFDLPHIERTSRYYVEASIDFQRKEPEFSWDRVPEDKKLLYCSLGTQSHRSSDGACHEATQSARKNFLQIVINVMHDRPDWQLILATGSYLCADDFNSIPPNAVLVESAPQIETLKKASLAITHGGLNTVKECIFFEVPMIVFPLAVDQFKNADCVVYHRLGLKGDVGNVSESLIHSLVDKIDGNPIFRSEIKTMKELFRRIEAEERAITFIESALRSGPVTYRPISVS